MTILFTSEDKEFQQKYPLKYQAMQEIDKKIGKAGPLYVHKEDFFSPYARYDKVHFCERHMEITNLKEFSVLYGHERKHNFVSTEDIIRRINNQYNKSFLKITTALSVPLSVGLWLWQKDAALAVGANIVWNVSLGVDTLSRGAREVAKSEVKADEAAYFATGEKVRDHMHVLLDPRLCQASLEETKRKGLYEKFVDKYFSGYEDIPTRREGGLDHITPDPTPKLLELFKIDEINRGGSKAPQIEL